MTKQLVVIGLEDQKFCVPIEMVSSIIETFSTTKVPNSRAYIEGVTNIRGDIVPVICLKKIFGIQRRSGRDARLLNVMIDGKNIGFLVDSASQVVSIESEMLSEMPRIVSSDSSRYFDMVANIGDELLIVLDLCNIFDEDEKRELELLIENN